jgi:O-antigen/teichoic acid export membrane protein
MFTPEIVHYVLGDKWKFAEPVLQIMALTAGFNQFGFNWAAFYKARNNTRPIALTGVMMMVAVIGLTVPLSYAYGVRGYALGMAGATSMLLVVRAWYLSRLFPSFAILRHALRAMLPTVPAVAAVLSIWRIDGRPRSFGVVLAEAVLYGLIVAAGTLYSERRLLVEVLGYLRGGAAVPRPAA